MSQLHFVRQGTGQVVVLSHARGCDLSMWEAVADLLAEKFTVLRYDHRGHGKSPVARGTYTLNALADDAAALIEEHAGAPVHFVGLALGGLVGQALAVRYPQWVRSLVIANASSQFRVEVSHEWVQRAQLARTQGMQALVESMSQRWFTPAFLADPAGARRAADLLAVFNQTDALSYAASCDAMTTLSQTSNRRIACPTLVIAGTLDLATPSALSDAVVLGISGAQLHTLDTALMSAVEQPGVFAALVKQFIRKI